MRTGTSYAFVMALIYRTMAQDVSNMLIEKYELCPGTVSTDVILYINPKNMNRGRQLADLNFSSPYPIGNNVLIRVSIKIESPIVKDRWVPFFTFDEEKGFCHGLSALLGEVAAEVERHMGVIPNTCPIPAGTYHAPNHLLDYNKLKFRSIPFGRVQTIIQIFHRQLKKIIACQIITISNIKR